MLKTDIDQSKPLYYDGFSDSGGHAFICDGYQSNDYFHFNWGWGGSDNGYFTVDALNTGAGNFNNWQSVIHSISPNEEDLVLTENIPDIILSEPSLVIDLSDHFESIGGYNITYSIVENSNNNAVTTSIVNNNLTLTKGSENGLSTIRVIANTATEQHFDLFDIKVMDQKPLAGFGNTYNFAGTSFVDIGNSTELNDMNLLSISAWVKLNELGKSHSVISKNSSTNSGWYFNINSINKIKFLVKAESGSSRKLYSLSTLPADEWIHLAGTYDGNDLKIYINGELNRESHFDDYQEIQQDENVNLFLGKSVSYYLDGNLDDVRLWNKGLSQIEVLEAMSSSLDGNDTELYGYWKIDENFGNTVNDISNFNNDGSIQGVNNYNWLSSQNEIAPLRFCSSNVVFSSFLLGDNSDDITFELVDNASGQAVLNDAETGEFSFTPSGSTSLEEFSYKIIEGNVSSEEIKVLVDNDLVGIEDNYELRITNYELKQNYPNPFNPVTKINYRLPVNTMHASSLQSAKIVVYNAAGQMVWSSPITPHSSQFTGSVLFDGSKFNSGVYYYSLVVDGKSMSTKAMILIK